MPAEYENHHPNHPLYVSENVRLCAGCSGQFELGAFNGLNSGNDSRRLRRICRTCERNEEQDQAVSQAGKALANAANLIAKPRFAGSDGAPLARTVMNATLARLYQAEQKAGRLENGESSGEQVLGRLFGEFVAKVFQDDTDGKGVAHTPFLRLKVFTALQRQMGDLLRHDQPSVDLSHLKPDELRELLTPFMLDWFQDNPDQFARLVEEIPERMQRAEKTQEGDGGNGG